MRQLTARPALALALAAVTASGAALAGSAIAAPTSPAPTAVVADQGPRSGFAPGSEPVWVVSEPGHIPAGLASAPGITVKDRSGKALQITRVVSDQLPAVHAAEETPRRGPGFRAFSSLAEAQAFVAVPPARSGLSAAPGYTLDNQATVKPWLAQVDHTKIKATIEHLSTAYPNRYYSTSYGKKAAEWLRTTWDGLAAGRDDVTSELFTGCSNCGTQPSVLLTVKGSEKPDEIVVIGGHIDSISSTGSGESMKAPGADDNASGAATVTEVMRVALKDGWKPKRTVVFAGYAAEEVGLRGSASVAKAFKSQGKDVVGVMQLDMTNYHPGSGPDMAFLTDNVNASLSSFGQKLFDTYLAPEGLTRGTMRCGYACSDHASWTDQGYPAFMVAEPEIFPDLHTTKDTLATMGNTAEPSVKFAKIGLAYLGEVAKTASSTTPAPTTPAPTTPAPTTPAPTTPAPTTPAPTTPAPTTPAPTTPAPGGSVLTSGAPVKGLSGAAGSMKVRTIDVPAGARTLTVTTSGGTGDVDLYVKAGSDPTGTSYDCRPYREGNLERCTVFVPRAGTYHVGLLGYRAYSGVALSATYAAY